MLLMIEDFITVHLKSDHLDDIMQCEAWQCCGSVRMVNLSLQVVASHDAEESFNTQILVSCG